MTGGSHPGRQGTCTWTSKPPWLSATAVVREFSYPLPSRGPLLSKQATPEVSADTHTPEPPERVAEVCVAEGSRTGPVQAVWVGLPWLVLGTPPGCSGPGPVRPVQGLTTKGVKSHFLSPGGGGKPYSLPPEGGDRARTPATTPGGDE